MAQAVETHWEPDIHLEGIAITRYGHGLPTQRITVIEVGHPYSDQNGEMATRAIMESARMLCPDDLMLCLFSGGGSSLPIIEGVTFEELKEINRQLVVVAHRYKKSIPFVSIFQVYWRKACRSVSSTDSLFNYF